MNNQGEESKLRPKIIDTQDYVHNNNRGRNHRQVVQKKQHKQFVDETDDVVATTQYPIEMTPVMRAVLEYGRRTHALGALKGAVVISNLVSRIKSLGQVSPELKHIILDAEQDIHELKQLLSQAYAEG
jgi:hypothetical protein